MTEQLIAEIQRKMLPYLNNEQLMHLRDAMAETLEGATITYDSGSIPADEADAVEAFITAKRIEGCSEKTLSYYRKTIEALIAGVGKAVRQITTDDLRRYLTNYQVQRRSSKVTMVGSMNGTIYMPVGEVCSSISYTYREKKNMVTLINTSDVLEGRVLNHERVPNSNLKGQFKKTFQRDDILYSEIRPQNRRFAYVDFSPIDYIASTKLMVIRAKKDVVCHSHHEKRTSTC